MMIRTGLGRTRRFRLCSTCFILTMTVLMSDAGIDTEITDYQPSFYGMVNMGRFADVDRLRSTSIGCPLLLSLSMCTSAMNHSDMGVAISTCTAPLVPCTDDAPAKN